MKQKTQYTKKVDLKRKIESLETKPIKINKKAPLKTEVVAQLNELQVKYDTLKKENDQNIESLEACEATNMTNLEKIKELNEKLEQLEEEKAIASKRGETGVTFKCEECDFEAQGRTELSWHLNEFHGWPLNMKPEDLDMSNGVRFCSKCDYQAEDGYDMDGHKWGEHEDEDLESLRCKLCDQKFPSLKDLMYHKKDTHGCTWTEEEESSHKNDQNNFNCNVCEQTFKTRKELMVHKKEVHSERVAPCRKYKLGKCSFRDADCWFLHCEAEFDEECKKVTCNVCDEEFFCQSDFLKHRKLEHRNSVPLCKNERNGKCSFGKSNCWFIHKNLESESEKNDETNMEHNEVTEKLFKMLEKMTERIMKIEKENSNAME